MADGPWQIFASLLLLASPLARSPHERPIRAAGLKPRLAWGDGRADLYIPTRLARPTDPTTNGVLPAVTCIKERLTGWAGHAFSSPVSSAAFSGVERERTKGGTAIRYGAYVLLSLHTVLLDDAFQTRRSWARSYWFSVQRVLGSIHRVNWLTRFSLD
jgi:hypothetical protein